MPTRRDVLKASVLAPAAVAAARGIGPFSVAMNAVQDPAPVINQNSVASHS